MKGLGKGFFLSLFVILLVSSDHVSCAEKKPEDYKTFTFYLENDVFSGTDREYTNGIKLTWISQDLRDYRADTRVPRWSYPIIEHLPFVNEPGFQRNISLSIGQNMYTPEDTAMREPIEDDRPYAGIAYLAVGFHSKNRRRMDTFEIDLGIVGPHSYAEKTQKIVHDWIGSARPQGWQHQLKDEPILNLFYERKWKLMKLDWGRGLACDLIPHVGCFLGNAITGANFGGQIRFGWNLPNDFGTFLIRPGSDTNAPVDEQDPRFFPGFHRFGIHLLAGLDARAVARNIVLDGNTFQDSHSVEKRPFVANFIVGVGIIIHRIKISYSYVFQTKEFYSQKERQEYGAITVSVSY